MERAAAREHPSRTSVTCPASRCPTSPSLDPVPPLSPLLKLVPTEDAPAPSFSALPSATNGSKRRTAASPTAIAPKFFWCSCAGKRPQEFPITRNGCADCQNMTLSSCGLCSSAQDPLRGVPSVPVAFCSVSFWVHVVLFFSWAPTPNPRLATADGAATLISTFHPPAVVRSSECIFPPELVITSNQLQGPPPRQRCVSTTRC